MVALIAELFRNDTRISVQEYQGLTADFARQVNANFVLRGLRNTTDFEYENTISVANRYLLPELENRFSDYRSRAGTG